MTKPSSKDLYAELFAQRGIDCYGACCLPENLRVFSGLAYALSFMVPLPRVVLESIKGGPSKLYFHHYRTINAYIDNISLNIALLLNGEGFDAHYVPASQSQSQDGLRAIFPHKAAARLAGLGDIGCNALFISSKYGPGVRLGTVLTNMPLCRENPKPLKLCTACMQCVNACPSGALTGASFSEGMPRDGMIDAQKCSHYMKRFKDVGRGAVCGICMANCPLCHG